MACAIMPFAVDLEWFRKILGCAEREIVDDDLAEWADELDRIDRTLGLSAEAGCRLAYERMIMGGEQEGHPAAYGYCFERLCLKLGTFLPNDCWSAMDGRFFDAVRSALRTGGVHDFEPRDLVGNGPGVPLPEIAGFPLIGHVPNGRTAALVNALDGLNAEAVADAEALEAIAQMHDWLRECESGGDDLVCFYH